jgi:hypothetical protein
LVGRRLRPGDWWQTPENLAILRSNLKLREIGELLHLDTGEASRVRKRAREFVQPEPVDLAA